jgi:hypothetical protein
MIEARRRQVRGFRECRELSINVAELAAGLG